METLLLAQAQAQGGNPFLGLLPMLLVLAVFWFIVIVPARRQQKAHAKLVAELKRGDTVVTQGGIIGEIVGLRDDSVQLRSGQATFVVERGKIAGLRTEKAAEG